MQSRSIDLQTHAGSGKILNANMLVVDPPGDFSVDLRSAVGQSIYGLVIICFENEVAQNLRNAVQTCEDNTNLTELTLQMKLKTF